MLIALAAIAACGAIGQPVLLNSFEDEDIVARLNPSDAEVERVREHATDGEWALKVRFGVTDWPQVMLEAGKAYEQADWSSYGAIVFDMHNPEDDSIVINMRIDDAAEGDGRVHSRQTGVAVPPGETVTACLSIPEEELFMRSGPPSATGDVNASLSSGEIDKSHIIRFQFYLALPAVEHVLYIDNVRLATAATFDRIVDRFGQYTEADWPGKIHDEADLEADEPAGALGPEDRDEYGGWATGPTLEATGWFRTEKVDGKWWLVTPTGHLFWSTGMDCVGSSQWGPIKGREDLFTYLPEADDPLSKYGGEGTEDIDFYKMNLHRKYGEDFYAQHVQNTRQRLKTWGFNTVGNWADWDQYRDLRIPYTAPIHTGGGPSFQGAWREIPDVYDREFASVATKNITGATDTFGQDPYCIGYFVDNELPWGHWEGDARYPIAVNALQLTGERAVKQVFTRWMMKEYRTIEKLNEAWGTSIESWPAFRDEPVDIPDMARAQPDLSMLVSDYAERYFSTVAGLMGRHAPDQLYLGPRFAVATPEVLEAAAEHCDVLSFNIYGKAENLLVYAENFTHIDLPVIIGEFHFGALDRGMFHGGLVPVPSQEDRGQHYAEYVRTAAQQPWCVGAHWFQYIDEPLTGRFDGENYNIGFVTIADVPYPELVRQATEANREVYEVRAAQ